MLVHQDRVACKMESVCWTGNRSSANAIIIQRYREIRRFAAPTHSLIANACFPQSILSGTGAWWWCGIAYLSNLPPPPCLLLLKVEEECQVFVQFTHYLPDTYSTYLSVYLEIYRCMASVWSRHVTRNACVPPSTA